MPDRSRSDRLPEQFDSLSLSIRLAIWADREHPAVLPRVEDESAVEGGSPPSRRPKRWRVILIRQVFCFSREAEVKAPLANDQLHAMCLHWRGSPLCRAMFSPLSITPSSGSGTPVRKLVKALGRHREGMAIRAISSHYEDPAGTPAHHRPFERDLLAGRGEDGSEACSAEVVEVGHVGSHDLDPSCPTRPPGDDPLAVRRDIGSCERTMVGQAVEMGPVGTHREDVLEPGSHPDERDLLSVREEGWIIVDAAPVGESVLVGAVGVHQVDLEMAAE